DGTTDVFTAVYTYDALNRRVQEDRWVTGGSTITTRYAFATGREVWAELDGSNVVQVRWLCGQGETQVLAHIDTNGVRWLLADKQGTVRDVVTATRVKAHVESAPFGAIASETSAADGVGRGFEGLYQDKLANIAFADNRV